MFSSSLCYSGGRCSWSVLRSCEKHYYLLLWSKKFASRLARRTTTISGLDDFTSLRSFTTQRTTSFSSPFDKLNWNSGHRKQFHRPYSSVDSCDTSIQTVIRHEVQQTARVMMTHPLFASIQHEIQHAVHQHTSIVTQQSPPPFLGPSGRYWYQWISHKNHPPAAAETHGSVYQRWPTDTETLESPERGTKNGHHQNNKSNPDNMETVLDLRYQHQQHPNGNQVILPQSVVVSADETMVAYLVQVSDSEPQQATTTTTELWVHPIGSDIYHRIIHPRVDAAENNTSDQNEDMDALQSSIGQVEFCGPIRNPNDNDDTASSSCRKQYQLVWTVTNPYQDNRPYGVYGCTVTTTRTTKTTTTTPALESVTASPPRLIHHDHDLSHRLELYGTKASGVVVLQVETLDSNQCYLMTDLEEPPIMVQPRQAWVRYHVEVLSSSSVGRRSTSINTNKNKNDDTSYDEVEPLENDHDANTVWVVAPNHGDGSKELAVWTTHYSELLLSHDWFLRKAPCLTAAVGYVLVQVDIYQTFVVLYEQSSVDGHPQLRVVPCSGRQIWTTRTNGRSHCRAYYG